MIRAVIFDMDGLLIDSEPLWRRAQQIAYKTVGIELDSKEIRWGMGRPQGEVVAHWYHKYPWKGLSQADMEAFVVDNLITLVKQEAQLKPGVHRAIKICQQLKLPLAIASSSRTEIIDTVVDKLKIRSYFKYIYSGENEPFGKPHPGIFITTANLLDVSPQNVVVFEDAPAGVLAAKAAKMHCIAVPELETKDHPFIQTADIIIDSLDEFEASMLDHLKV
jgi:sugar-phosphatase